MGQIENPTDNHLHDTLDAILRQVPSITRIEAVSGHAAGAMDVDLIATVITSDSRQYRLAVEFSSQGHPRQLREAINRLLRYGHQHGNEIVPVVAAPYVSAEGAALCSQEKVGYCDFSGNCRLSFGGIFVERTGSPNRFPRAASAPDLYAPKSERVLRVLLRKPAEIWKVVPLAEAARVSVGTVSTVRSLLLNHEWARETGTGIALARPEKLLQDWAAIWVRRRVRIHRFITLSGVNEVECQLAGYARGTTHSFALTGAAAAWRHAPMVRYQRVQAYWNGDIEKLAYATGLRPAEAGFNVQIIEPRDEGIFFDLADFDSVPAVSPVQTFLDLQQEPARGAEAAAFLWDTVLFPDHAARQ
ncbi:hypothetical protein OpiT1DRAFT_02710 [Opitutaceae bacterium TAV1]|nr:hypothetical protein OpiT1DRAFT_02710 [Opitutaceae bacterium TAV1]